MNAAAPRNSQPPPSDVTRFGSRPSSAGSAGSNRGRPARPAGRSRRTGTGRSTRAAMAGMLIGSASRKNAVDRAGAVDGGRLEDLLGQAAHEVAEQEDRERQPVRRVRQPDRQERCRRCSRPFGPYSWRIGMSVVCSGTTSRPTTTTNRMFAAREAHPRERVRGERRDEDRDDRRRDRDEQAVDERLADVALARTWA